MMDIKNLQSVIDEIHLAFSQMCQLALSKDLSDSEADNYEAITNGFYDGLTDLTIELAKGQNDNHE